MLPSNHMPEVSLVIQSTECWYNVQPNIITISTTAGANFLTDGQFPGTIVLHLHSHCKFLPCRTSLTVPTYYLLSKRYYFLPQHGAHLRAT